jgi:hypothetical protein
VDEITKHPNLVGLIEPGDILLCERSSRILSRLIPELEIARIDLPSISIRDFPEITCIYSLKATDANYSAVKLAHKRSRDGKYGIASRERLVAA